MRLVFLGSPSFAVPSLEALLRADHEVLTVVTQPDQPKGRGQKLAPPPVKLAALEHGLSVAQPKKARDGELARILGDLAPDLAVVVAYGKILPKTVLDAPRLGCVNVHASLLPRYRGAAPIQRAILAGERETGITIMQLDEGLDTGPMLMRKAVAIDENDTAESLSVRLAARGADLLIESLAALARGELTEEAQDASLATHAPPLAKNEGHIDWHADAECIRNRIRGLDPWPGAFTSMSIANESVPLRVFRGSAVDLEGVPGTILAVLPEGVVVACGKGAIALGELQLAGKKRLTASAFAAGRASLVGTVLS